MKRIIVGVALAATLATAPAAAHIPERCALLGDSAMFSLERRSGTKAAIDQLLADDTITREAKRSRYVDILFERDQHSSAALEKLILFVDCAQGG